MKKTHKARQVIRQNLSDALKTKKLHYSLVDTPYVSIPMSNIYSQQVSHNNSFKVHTNIYIYIYTLSIYIYMHI